jgi:hypothetical protein
MEVLARQAVIVIRSRYDTSHKIDYDKYNVIAGPQLRPRNR